MIEKKVIGFVYKKVDYKDNDAIFNVLTCNSKEVFKARGINKITSKNKGACNFYTISEFVLQAKSETSNQTLKTASIIKIYKKPFDDILISSSYAFIFSLLEQLSDDFNGYDLAIKCFDYLENDTYPLDVLNYFLKNMCFTLGYEPNLVGCVNCNNKNNLISFDFELGGFICKNCFDSKLYTQMNPSFLKGLYNFFKSNELVKMEDYEALYLFKLYLTFTKNVCGLRIDTSIFVLNCL